MPCATPYYVSFGKLLPVEGGIDATGLPMTLAKMAFCGFAAIIVVMVHARVAWLQGGVSIISTFFPLSGFLFTRNLLREIDGSNRVDFRRFWTRRVRRLFPSWIR